MRKLSVLIFSRNDISQALGLIKQVYGIADEVVVVDSSDRQENRLLHRETKWLKNVRIVYVVPMGYPDPIFIYSVKKCRHEWVLRLDVDERLSPALLSRVRGIVNNATCDGFAIKRYESVTAGERTRFFTWQVRLFKKDRVSFKGLLHDQPEVKGRLRQIDDNEVYLEHVTELMHHETNRYNRMEKYERYSYRLYNQKVIEYLAKLRGRTPREEYRSGLGSFLNSALLFYERITFRNMDKEISNFDYFVLRWARNLTYKIKEGGVLATFSALPDALAYIKDMKRWRAEPDAQENFEIAKRINGEGLIKYLRFDKERTVDMVNKRYAKDRKGIELMFRLLKDRYAEEMEGRS